MLPETNDAEEREHATPGGSPLSPQAESTRNGDLGVAQNGSAPSRGARAAPASPAPAGLLQEADGAFLRPAPSTLQL